MLPRRLFPVSLRAATNPTVDYRLAVFRTVAEQASFTRASKILHLSQPAVTQHIKALEDELGQALFARNSQGVSLTRAGSVLLKHARLVARMDEALAQEIQRESGVIRGRLALGATSTIGQYLLPEWLIESRRKWPALVLHVDIQNTEQILEGVLGGKLDLGLIEGRCRRVGLQAESFLDDEIICIASAKNPLTHGGAVSLTSLKAQLWVFRERGSGTRDIAEIALKRHGLDPRRLKVDLELASSEAIKAVVAGGHGLTFLSRFVVRREIALGILRPVPIRNFAITRKLHLVYPRGPRPGGAAGAFASLVHRAGSDPGSPDNPAITSGYDI
jgi:DNA-binding transcriptional LysR family regulator